MCGAFFLSYLALRRHELQPAGVAAWSSFVLMTVAASVWGVRFVATMPVSTVTHALTWAALVLVCDVRSLRVRADQGGLGAADAHAVASLR